jgi:VWFA-related protein
MSIHGSVVATVLASVVLAGDIAARQQQRPTFRTAVNVVRLDVTVLDEQRRPVRGLTAADFSVRVNGQDQPIEGVIEVVAPALSVTGAAWMRGVAPDVITNANREPRLWVLILDDALMPGEAWVMNNGRRIARSVVDRLGPSDLAAVVFTLLNQYAQDFTNDRAKLYRAIDYFYPAARGFPLGAFYSRSTLNRVLGALSRYPSHRKAVVYVSSGIVPMRSSVRERFGLPEMWEVLDDTNAIRDMLSLDTSGDLGSVTHGQLSNIPVYGISYLGLVAPTSAERNPEITDGVAKSGNNTLRTLASNTGGRAITETNDPLPGIEAIFEENSSWYVIGYRPTYPLADGRYRNFQLKVNRRGVSVWPANRRFEQPKPEALTKIKPVAAATDALSGLLPMGDVPLRVSLVPFARIGAGRDEAPASVAVILGALAGAAPAAAGRESFDLELRAFDGEGRRAFGIVQRHIEWPVTPGSAGADILMSIDLRPGRYSLRLGASSPARAKSGSVYADVIVPDFARDALSLSGLVLSRPGPERTVFAGLDRDALPVVPTTAREFAKDDVVTAFVRVYQGSRARPGAVTVNTRIVDAQDAVVHTSTLEMPQEKFSGQPRASDFQMRLPLSELPAGEYLLTIEAVAGEHRSPRHARFSVK